MVGLRLPRGAAGLAGKHGGGGGSLVAPYQRRGAAGRVLCVMVVARAFEVFVIAAHLASRSRTNALSASSRRCPTSSLERLPNQENIAASRGAKAIVAKI